MKKKKKLSPQADFEPVTPKEISMLILCKTYKSDHAFRQIAESSYVTYRMEISAPSAQ